MAKQKNKTTEELLQELIDKIEKLTILIGIQGNFNKSYLKKLSKAGFNQYEMQNLTGIDQSDISRELRGIKRRGNKKQNDN